MSSNKLMYAARKASFLAMLNEAENSKDVSLIHLTVLACNPNEPNSPLFWNAPVDKVQPNGCITLSIGVGACGARHFNEYEMLISVRFNGVEHNLEIPYSLIASFVAFNNAQEALIGEGFGPFMPYVGTVVEAGEANEEEAAHAPEVKTEGNVVTGAFGAKRANLH
jgi:hypothetical protein